MGKGGWMLFVVPPIGLDLLKVVDECLVEFLPGIPKRVTV